ncbi:ABC-2 type transport system permease protein [Halobacillus alkaliphilus]|uniref:ABC-2 type transport system permease protein n=1 Tax=Halobacillus alkaliphilus TaxID=396056 RepID=A0A1I2MMD0_9BACI|nr:ABC transporter permease [Halobacillus alkaliphilus]SFF92602.1 ABC-2 type transport system permease protein [Halobacillus alkaliphilus]
MHFLKILQNEHIKIYKKTGTWIIIGILVTLLLGFAMLQKYVLDNGDQSNWRNQAEARIAQMEEGMERGPDIEAGREAMGKEIAIQQYRLDNDLPPVAADSLWGFMIDATNFTAIATLFTIVIAAGIVASEFSTGTIKLLLIRPVRRGKILLAKFITTMMFALFMLILLFGFSYIIGLAFFGSTGSQLPYLTYTGGEVVEKHMAGHIISLIGFRSIEIIMMATVAFMISTIFRSSSLAIGFSIFLMFTGPQIVQLLSQYDWVKFVLFANTNLMQYVDGTPVVEGMTMSFSIVVLLIYFFVFLVSSWVIFKQRDVAV